MGNKAIQRVGDWTDYKECLAFNRTGATLTKGQVVQADLAQDATETDSISTGDETGSVWANVVKVQTADADAGFPILVAAEDIEDDKRGRFIICGIADVSVVDDATATTNVDAGDPVSIAANDALAVEAGASGDRILGTALEDADATTTTTKKVWWRGGLGSSGFVA